MRNLRIAVAITITAVWVVVYASTVLFGGDSRYLPEVTGVMLIVAGWLFGADVFKRR